MRTRIDEALVREATELRLRFACPDCAFFDPATRTCAEGYPNAVHLGRELEPARTLEFCKSFELA
jgi:hypothetical protein